MEVSTNKPYAWLMPKVAEQKADGDLKKGGGETTTSRLTKGMTPSKGNNDSVNQPAFGEASFVKKSAPSFFRSIGSLSPQKNVSPVKEAPTSHQAEEKISLEIDEPIQYTINLPDIIDLPDSSDDEWITDLNIVNHDENTNHMTLPAQKDDDVSEELVSALIDEEKNSSQTAKESTLPQTQSGDGLSLELAAISINDEKHEEVLPPIEIAASSTADLAEAKNLSIIKEVDEFDSDDDGWNDIRNARFTDRSTSFIDERSPLDLMEMKTTTSGFGHQAFFASKESDHNDDNQVNPPKDNDKHPEAQTPNGIYPIYFDTQDEIINHLVAVESGKAKPNTNTSSSIQKTPVMQEISSSDDDGWNDYRKNDSNANHDFNLEFSNKTSTFDSGTIQKTSDWSVKNGSKVINESGDSWACNQWGTHDTSKDSVKNGLSSVKDFVLPVSQVQQAKTDNNQKISHWAANGFFSKVDNAWNNAPVREKHAMAPFGGIGAVGGGFNDSPRVAQKLEMDWKRDIHPMHAQSFGLPIPQKPEKRIARESLRGFERILKSNKAVNSRRENKLAENAKQKLCQRSKTPDFDPRLLFTKKQTSFDSLLPKAFTPPEAPPMQKFLDKGFGTNNNNNSHEIISLKMESRPGNVMPMVKGKRAASEILEITTPTSQEKRYMRVAECTRRLFKQKEIRDFVRVADQQTYFKLVEDLALL